MKLDDGREVLVKLELPLPLDVAAELMRVLAHTLGRLGYTDVGMLDDGTSRIVGKPPSRYGAGRGSGGPSDQVTP